MNAFNHDSLCPACGRFPGQFDSCEYCDTEMPGAAARRFIRQFAAVSSVLGLLLLLYASRGPHPKAIYAEDISPLLNHALVKISGRIASEPFVKQVEDRVEYASFLVDDNTGLVRVALKGDDAMLFSARRPGQGDRFEAVGTLQVRAGREPRIFVRRAGGEVLWTLDR